MSNFARVIAVASLLTFGLAEKAFAHAHLTSATPAVGSTVTASPTELDLTFSEDVNLKFTGVIVTGPKKTVVKTGKAMLMSGNTKLMVPIEGALDPGLYTVAWHALSTDGHKTNGTYSFTLKP